MTITRYRTHARRRDVAWVVNPWTVIGENGDLGASWPTRTAFYADADAAVDWFTHRIGTLLRWEERRIAWLPAGLEGPQVRLVKDSPIDEDEAAAGLFTWAEWARSEGASPGSPGGTGISLMRATLDERDRIVAWTKGVPQFNVAGGRIGGRLRPGPWTGDAVQLDLPAAYASTLGHLTWEGEFRAQDMVGTSEGRQRRSRTIARSGTHDPLGTLASDGNRIRLPALIEATVNVPAYLDGHGPLPVRPDHIPTSAERLFASLDDPTLAYPTGTTISGIWTAEEIANARDCGCDVHVSAAWSMPRNARLQPFLPWWRAIERGRSLPGFAGELAKRTGNAAVGALCMRPGMLRHEHWEDRRRVLDDLPQRRPAPRHHLLYETVTGQVRARLWRDVLNTCDALFWHTDGAWIDSRDLAFPAAAKAVEGWRRKRSAVAIDYLNPATYAYSADSVTTAYVVSGEPSATVAAEFDKEWANTLHDPARRRRATPHLEGRAA